MPLVGALPAGLRAKGRTVGRAHIFFLADGGAEPRLTSGGEAGTTHPAAKPVPRGPLHHDQSSERINDRYLEVRAYGRVDEDCLGEYLAILQRRCSCRRFVEVFL